MYYNFSKEEMDEIRERYDLAMERIGTIGQEETVQEPFREYFQKVASFLQLVDSTFQMNMNGRIKQLSRKEHQALNRTLFEDLLEDNYESSYANPSYACKKLGKKAGKVLAFLYTELRSLISLAYEGQLYMNTIYLELFIEIYNYYESMDEFTYKDVKRAIYDFMHDYCGVLTTYRVEEMSTSDFGVAKEIIMGSDLTDLSYLYRFGEYISENEIKVAEFLNSMPEEQIQAMADTFTEGYRLGFLAYRLDLSSKNLVNIRYQLGFERIVRCAIDNFKKMGLETVIHRASHNAMNKKQHLKIGYHGSSPNRQYDYDHRFDIGLFLDKSMNERRLECRKAALERFKEIISLYAGPAVMEVFGEVLFTPEDKKEAVKLDKRQQKLFTDFYNRDSMIQRDYYKLDETSFTIIAYPIPEIGEDFEAIFADTVRVNNLDNNQYRRIQQSIIDALDQGEYVRILGGGKNHTDMRVKLYPLQDKEKETIFENCVADVNIPVGEVFTSPVLEGTKGVLHVSKVYLNDLEYRDLKLTFEDGKVIDYTCRNYEDEEMNKSFIKENLLYNHDFLPLGEFAIGTNTTAYMMARKYDIASQLPILIAEKTGPHFAVGDTCYQMSEDNRIYNPNGKEIVAKENEISALRKTDISKAYFNCHTDITLPYDELKEISVELLDGTTIPIIREGRFVLKGTEELNLAFEE